MYQNRHLSSGRVLAVEQVAAAFANKLELARVPLVAVSGAFDPLHVGNLKCIQGAAMLKGEDGLLVVIVNSDEYCLAKKGYTFMPLDERMELVSALAGVDFVVPWYDGTMTVSGALQIIKPTIFAKGGSHSALENVPEFDVCKEVGCAVVFGIGGNVKLQSSSRLVEKMQKPRKKTTRTVS